MQWTFPPPLMEMEMVKVLKKKKSSCEPDMCRKAAVIGLDN